MENIAGLLFWKRKENVFWFNVLNDICRKLFGVGGWGGEIEIKLPTNKITVGIRKTVDTVVSQLHYFCLKLITNRNVSMEDYCREVVYKIVNTVVSNVICTIIFLRITFRQTWTDLFESCLPKHVRTWTWTKFNSNVSAHL